jgi:hypothetical protein
MRLRPSGESLLPFPVVVFAATALELEFFDAPRAFLDPLDEPAVSKPRAFFSCAISRSIEAKISDIPIVPPLALANGQGNAGINEMREAFQRRLELT